MAKSTASKIIEDLSEDEKYLWCILSDESGLDLAEFSRVDEQNGDAIWRAWPFQWKWYRCMDPLQISHCARAVGKSQSIAIRAFAFPFMYPGQEMLITAPELVHLEPITTMIEHEFYRSQLGRHLLQSGRSAVNHRPFQCSFKNGARIIGRIPQRDGRGVKGCVDENAIVLAERGFVSAKDVTTDDRVWTHESRWMPVLHVQRFVDDVCYVSGQGIPDLMVSEQHRFYGRRNIARNSKQNRRFGPELWAGPEDLDNFYWASPAKFDGDIAIPPCGDLTLDEDFWWIVGLFVADGFTSTSGIKKNGKYACRAVNFAINNVKQNELVARLDSLSLFYSEHVRSHSSANIIKVGKTSFARWLDTHFGMLADGKFLPSWLLFQHPRIKRAFLEGYAFGDGHVDKRRKRLTVSSASRRIIFGVKLLAQSLGYTSNVTVMQPNVKVIRERDLKKKPKLSWRLQITDGYGWFDNQFVYTKVRGIKEKGTGTVVNIVTADQSYIADGIVCHNSHPLWLEQDEASDYPSPGWVELTETLKRGVDGAVWRSHGVTRGVRDHFFKFTSDPNTRWTVHRWTGMHRPTWSDDEREEKIAQYGGREDADYRRNILGEHGDATSPIFVLHRLMSIVDDDKESSYNSEEYTHLRISDSWLRETNSSILDEMFLPVSHLDKYKTFWVGMDVGFCVDEATEIFTQRGWLSWPDLEKGDLTLSIDPTTGMSEWQMIDHVHVFDARKRSMIHMEGQSFDSLTTPNHRWLVMGDGENNWRWKTTETLNTKDRIPLTVERSDTPLVPTHKDNFVESVAWQSMTIKTVDYRGRIWCPTLKFGNWLARRDGSVYFTGNTNHPSEILVFGEERISKTEYDFYTKSKTQKKTMPSLIHQTPFETATRLKLITRINMKQISSPDQKTAIMHVINHYHPRVFALDKTGLGLPMFQDLQKEVEDLEQIKTVIKGYNFSGKIIVDLDLTIEVDDFIDKEELINQTGIRRDVVEYATDTLRKLVDEGRLWLPWDEDLLKELQGQTYKITKTTLNQYGRREVSAGKFHAFDAARMAALGWAQFSIEEFIQKDDQESTQVLFMGD